MVGIINYKETEEYWLVSEFYKDKKAQRSGLPYIKHIDDGINIMVNRKNSEVAIRAFTIHPLLQANKDYDNNIVRVAENVHPWVLSHTLEYCKVANAYLAKDYKGPDDVVEIAVRSATNDMLIADKLQNYQDLAVYNSGHPNYNNLRNYFMNWFRALGILVGE